MISKTKNLSFVQFGILSANEWRNFAVCEIFKPAKGTDLLKNADTTNTPYDERMGPLDNGRLCLKCNYDNQRCPGHFGYINLEEPVYNPQFFDTVVRILKCVCPACGQCRLSDDNLKLSGLLGVSAWKRLSSIVVKCEKKKSDKKNFCQFEDCGSLLPSYQVITDGTRKSITMIDPERGDIPLSCREVYDILVKISNRTFFLLGFNQNLSKNSIFSDPSYLIDDTVEHVHQIRPESFIFTVFPVIPPRARPWVTRNGEKNDDDLTEKYNMIIKANIKLKEHREHEAGKFGADDNKRRKTKLTEIEKKKVLYDLEEHIRTLIDNHKEDSTSAGGRRAHMGLYDRIQGKGGHCQSGVTGKRVDFSARTVIVGGGPYLEVGQLGVPEYICKTLTVPEVVTDKNLSYLQNLIDEGKANYVFIGNQMVNLEVATQKFTKPYRLRASSIKEVIKVERHLRDGDWVLFNRQPTLRIESIQGMQVKVLKDQFVFRLPLAVAKAFNADFDGDEMNLHAPQNIRAQAECEWIMATKNRLVSAQHCKPVAGIVQDGLNASFILTNFDTMVKWKIASDCIVHAGLDGSLGSFLKRANKYYSKYISHDKKNNTYSIKEEEIPGKLFLSILFPENLHYTRKTNTNPQKPVVKIEYGIITPDSGPLCAQVIGIKGGSICHVLWVEYGCQVAEKFLSSTQFLTDKWFPSHGFSMGISDCLTTCRDEVTSSLAQMDASCIEITRRNQDEKIRERDINAELNSAMGVANVFADKNMNKGEKNALNIMRQAGSKGSVVNCSQIGAFVGQQNVEGKRIPALLSDQTRCLPHFEAGDNSPEARGFVYSCFLNGLTPAEQFYHACGGRQGIIDTAVKTADSGYAQKRIGKKLEDFVTKIDGSVRDANGKIVSYLYGEDGFDAKKLFFVEGLSHPFFCNPSRIAHTLSCEVPEQPRRKLKDEEVKFLCSFLVIEPVTDVTQEAIKNIRTDLATLVGSKNFSIAESVIPKFCRKILDMFSLARCNYSEMVGLVAASSIGEPTTQMTLNTFHQAGNSAKDVTLGLPRLNELFNATKKPSTPSCTVFFTDPKLKEESKLIKKFETESKDEEIKSAKRRCLEILQLKKSYLEEIDIGMFVKDVELFYLPEDNIEQSPVKLITYKEYSPSWWVKMSNDMKLNEDGIQPEHWVIHLVMDVAKMFEHSIEMDDICRSIKDHLGESLFCIQSPLNIGIIEVYANFSNIKQYIGSKLELTDGSDEQLINSDNVTFFTARDVVVPKIKSIMVRGVKTISKAFPREDKVTKEWVLDTTGSNLEAILQIDGVDTVRTISNNMWEVFTTFGIEAARAFLIEEMTKIISFDGTYVNPRHIEILVDSMTHTGIITSARQSGIGREAGPYAKGTFEKIIENMATSAQFTETDHIDGMLACITLGVPMKGGTGGVVVKSGGNSHINPSQCREPEKPKGKAPPIVLKTCLKPVIIQKEKPIGKAKIIKCPKGTRKNE